MGSVKHADLDVHLRRVCSGNANEKGAIIPFWVQDLESEDSFSAIGVRDLEVCCRQGFFVERDHIFHGLGEIDILTGPTIAGIDIARPQLVSEIWQRDSGQLVDEGFGAERVVSDDGAYRALARGVPVR